MVMTVGVVSALVARDSGEQLFVADAQALWGDIDVEVSAGGRPTHLHMTAAGDHKSRQKLWC